MSQSSPADEVDVPAPLAEAEAVNEPGTSSADAIGSAMQTPSPALPQTGSVNGDAFREEEPEGARVEKGCQHEESEPPFNSVRYAVCRRA